MVDKEKMIRGLETCRTYAHCMECPYAYDKRANDSCCESVLHNDVLDYIDVHENGHAYWHISAPENITCSNCGFVYYTGYDTMEEAEAEYNKPFGLYYCPHCGARMTREDGSPISLFNRRHYGK